MKPWKKTIVYRSKDESDWKRAQEILAKAGIEQYPFAAEEAPMAGCGVKLHPGKIWGSGKASSTIFRIEVALEGKESATNVLEGKVQPIRSYGFTAL